MSIGNQYICQAGERRDAVRAARGPDGAPPLNGIDFLEVVSGDQRTLDVHFIHALPGSGATVEVPPGASALTDDNIVIEGGPRAIPVEIVAPVVLSAPHVLTVTVAAPGDFSPYTLRLATSKADRSSPDFFLPPPGFDPQTSAVTFSFKVECVNDLDCRTDDTCPVEPLPAPDLNYLAKDYASFRQLMLDRMSVQMPRWTERNPADLGVALVELLAYTADHLSYQQDAIATEAYLDTARRRVSVKRHARLVDYHMHDGCNARAWVQLRVDVDVIRPLPTDETPNIPAVPRGTQLLTHVPGLPERVGTASAAAREALGRRSVEVFETMHDVQSLYLDHNDLLFYTWGQEECCLPAGATRATLRENRPNLRPGDVLIFAEARGPLTGETPDADPRRRQAVRLTHVVATDRDGNPLTDPLNGQPITEIAWHVGDALEQPFCLSSRTDEEHGQQLAADVSIALGNVVLTDHGRTIDAPDDLGVVPPPRLYRVPAARPVLAGGVVVSRDERRWRETAGDEGQHRPPVPPRYRPALRDASLTFAAPYPFAADEDVRLPARAALSFGAADAVPRITSLTGTLDGDSAVWEARRDLLNSARDAPEFVVEVESDGTARLRFGDDRHGARPRPGTAFSALYRVGNGTRGNVGREAIRHVVSDLVQIVAVGNPLPAGGGGDPESIERARQQAPFAFRYQRRAVTAADYVAVAEGHPGVQRAAATMRWTGSWHTVFLTIDRTGGLPVDPEFEVELRRYLADFRMAGHDLEIDDPRLVPLEIAMQVCVEPDYFRSDVQSALLLVFSSRRRPDGSPGPFHPDSFTFGQTVYLSPLYAAAETVPGVQSVRITTFQRQGQPATSALATGELALGRLEIATLENDPSFPDRGVFRLTVEGGR
jgi:hypothetical protein